MSSLRVMALQYVAVWIGAILVAAVVCGVLRVADLLIGG